MWDVRTWIVIGFTGQLLFTARFLAQWIASERKKDSVVPVAFWWLSLAGGLTLLSYAVYRQDPVIIVGQALGVFVYVRNLMLVAKGRRRAAKRLARAEKQSSPVTESTHAESRSTRHETQPDSRHISTAVPRPHASHRPAQSHQTTDTLPFC
jgi:lipid-A-disaccharide synthase-like uncharacterized protein